MFLQIYLVQLVLLLFLESTSSYSKQKNKFRLLQFIKFYDFNFMKIILPSEKQSKILGTLKKDKSTEVLKMSECQCLFQTC
jgi:hypothetical protein